MARENWFDVYKAVAMGGFVKDLESQSGYRGLKVWERLFE